MQGAVAAAGQAGTTPLPDKPTQQAWSEEPVLPLETLRKLDLEADLAFGQLTFDKLPLGDARLKARGKGGLVELEQLRGALYGGDFDAKASLDVRPPVPLITAQKRVNHIPVEKILTALEQKPRYAAPWTSPPTSAPAATARRPGSMVSTAPPASS